MTEIVAECPTCRMQIPLPAPEGSVCRCDITSARSQDGILQFGEGYAESIIVEHRRNLAGDKRSERLHFDRRFAEYCDAAFRRLCGPVKRPAVLSLGCGIGFELLELLRLGYDAYGMEVANLAPIWTEELGGDSWRCVLSTGGAIPFPDESFDLISCFNVFEHVGTVPPEERVTGETAPVREKFIRQAVAKLRPGGLLILVCPNRAYPFDAGHSHHYIAGSMERFIADGYTRADPFDARNFLPTRRTIIDACRTIARDTPLSLDFLTDSYLMGGPGPEGRHPGFDAILDISSRRWHAETGEPIESARNPHLQAFIRRAPAMRDDLGFDGRWSVTWRVSAETTHGAVWQRQAFLPRVSAQWLLGDAAHLEGDVLEITQSDNRTGHMVLTSISSGYSLEIVFDPRDENGYRRFTGPGGLAGRRQPPDDRHSIDLAADAGITTGEKR
jgi:SAM-dependent methyltransferase